MQPRVVISHRIGKEVMEMLSHSFVVVPNMTNALLTRSGLLRRARGALAMMVSDRDEINREFLDQCPSLLVVASTSNEPGRIDVQACTDGGVWLALAEDRSPKLRAELEAAANIFEAILGGKPKGAVNRPSPQNRATRRPPGTACCRQV